METHSTSDNAALVRVDRLGPVVTISLDSPHNRNALSSPLLSQLADHLGSAEADPDIRVIVLAATGTVFCSGADLAERRQAVPGQSVPIGATMPAVLRLMDRGSTPIVVAVNGAVRGGGLGLVAAADMAVARQSATFALTEVRVGVVPAMIAPPLLRKVARPFLSRYMLTGETFSTAQAVEAGLISHAVDDGPGTLEAAVGELVTALLKGSPQAIAVTRELLRQLDEMNFDDGLGHAAVVSEQMFQSAGAAEGMAAFLEKRPASWVVETP